MDGSCPYCAGLLLKESWVLRCPQGHRFRVSFRPSGDGASSGPGAFAGGTLVLRVVSHPERSEIGRLHVYTVAPSPAADPSPPGGDGR